MINAEKMRQLAQKMTKHFEKNGSYEERCKYWDCLLQIKLAANRGLTTVTTHIDLSNYNAGFSIDRIVAKLEARGFKVKVKPWFYEAEYDDTAYDEDEDDDDDLANEDFDLVISWDE